MHTTIRYILAASVMLCAAYPVSASFSNQVPEPGILGLLAAGGIVGLLVAIRKRRK